jgi:hypothetical protein
MFASPVGLMMTRHEDHLRGRFGVASVTRRARKVLNLTFPPGNEDVGGDSPLGALRHLYGLLSSSRTGGTSMQGRFEIRLAEGERGDLRECAAHAGLSEAAVVRFGLRWAINRFDVLANGGAEKTGRTIAAFFDEMRADPRLAPLVVEAEAALAAMDLEGDTIPSAAALHDLVSLIAAEPIPLVEKIRLIGDLMNFEGTLSIRRRPKVTAFVQPEGMWP